MKLTDLEPQFIRHEIRMEFPVSYKPPGVEWAESDKVPGEYIVPVDAIESAQGIMFLCPKCFQANGGKVGTHRVICWSRSRGTPEDVGPKPGRWTIEGTGFGDLTLNGDLPGAPGTGARSVLLNGGCEWHGFITNGEAT